MCGQSPLSLPLFFRETNYAVSVPRKRPAKKADCCYVVVTAFFFARPPASPATDLTFYCFEATWAWQGPSLSLLLQPYVQQRGNKDTHREGFVRVSRNLGQHAHTAVQGSHVPGKDDLTMS